MRSALLVVLVCGFLFQVPLASATEPLAGWVQQGRVEISAIHGWGIAVGIDSATKESGPDGIVDRVYMLQVYGPKPADLPRELDDALVLETESGIRVVSETTKFEARLELASDEDALFGPQGLDLDGIHRFRGFGLSRIDQLRLAFPLEASWLAQFPPPDGRGPLAECDSGGAGSTSCSVENGHGGCSVTCAAGYTACCSNAGWASPAVCSCTPVSGGSGGGAGGAGGGGWNDECLRGPGGFCDVSCMACTLY